MRRRVGSLMYERHEGRPIISTPMPKDKDSGQHASDRRGTETVRTVTTETEDVQ